MNFSCNDAQKIYYFGTFNYSRITPDSFTANNVHMHKINEVAH